MEQARNAIVILGASGDLAKRKLIPALLKLCQGGRIDSSTLIVGSGRSAFTHESFRGRFDVPEPFASRLFYHQGLSGLRKFIGEKGGFAKITVFFALPPQVYAETARELAEEGFGPETSIIVEKPFGADYESAVELNRRLSTYFPEANIFRSDHYLAKEAVQNIFVFRFANAVFFPVWNNQFIESIQIRASETQGVGDRGAYFDSAGILRDMVQNHLMQLVCLLAMEPPLSLLAEDIVEKKTEVLRAITIDECHRYQYDGYRREKGVNAGSTTETYAEVKLHIDTFRWAGVPVYIRSGKALGRDGTEIGVRLKPLPGALFGHREGVSPNTIIFLIQPNAGIIVSIAGKEVGSEITLTDTTMRFCYSDRRKGGKPEEIPEAYQRLLLDAVRGDHTLSVTARETELSWKVMEKVLDKGDVHFYSPGQTPATNLGVEWIDFERYYSSCTQQQGEH
jgi:glucose-6-phosphate 1-dehydrogenase